MLIASFCIIMLLHEALFKPFKTGRTFNFMSSSVHNIIPILFTFFVSATCKTFTDRMQLSIINLRRDSGWTFRFSIAFMFWRIGAHDVQIDISTGQGKIEFYRTTPLPGQMTQFHLDTSKWWIYYSNIFGIGMLVIAFTVMFIEWGKNSFQGWRWKLALIRIIFHWFLSFY